MFPVSCFTAKVLHRERDVDDAPPVPLPMRYIGPTTTKKNWMKTKKNGGVTVLEMKMMIIVQMKNTLQAI